MSNAPLNLSALVGPETRPVAGIDPVDGWALFTFDERDNCGFTRPGYVAVRGDEARHLNVSRFRFTPSQDRFAWLVRTGFPSRAGKILGPWDDTDIEMMMAVPEMAR